MSSILIVGLGKTGTTGVYNAIKQALVHGGREYNFLFEPTSPAPFRALGRYEPYRPILTKVVMPNLADCEIRYEDFEHRLLTVRDPRDVVVSALLFWPLIRRAVGRTSEADLARFIDAIREKESDPTSWSFLDLCQLAANLNLRRSSWPRFAAGLERCDQLLNEQEFTAIRYEDFVDGRLDDLSANLGLEVTNPAATGNTWLGHIARSMGHGDWRQWFLKEDADYFNDLFATYLGRHGYERGDPLQPVVQRIDPATSSEYIARKLADRERQVSARYRRAWTPEGMADPDEVVNLEQMAEDGDAVAAHRAALVYDRGTGPVSRDAGRALDFARAAAIRGNRGGMSLLPRLLRETATSERADLDARFWERELDMLNRQEQRRPAGSSTNQNDVRRLQQRVRRLERRASRAERALEQVRGSRRYRLGSLLVETARGPLRKVGPAISELVRLSCGRQAR